jgi:hypothetical protein
MGPVGTGCGFESIAVEELLVFDEPQPGIREAAAHAAAPSSIRRRVNIEARMLASATSLGKKIAALLEP